MNIEEYKQLVKKETKPKRKQIEGQHQRELGRLLNGRLKPLLNPNLIFWTYSAAGEFKPIKTATLQKQKGLSKGHPDYVFHLLQDEVLRLIFLETKTQKANLTDEQEIFFEKHKNIKNVSCYESKSIEESIRILQFEAILLSF